jgi:hypothetical protein
VAGPRIDMRGCEQNRGHFNPFVHAYTPVTQYY